ncbi:UbiX family flavin prenyltransferase [Dactylosporangium sp. CA-233914]|uniref:UbiX family flavin prenyltransferase n=1 Tax=Dactylosporangium sp. CA-233914 TaxID=3239934 RepID=UPI003D8E06F5
MSARRLVVAMSGASGLPYGVAALRALREHPDIESHLIISPGARTAVPHELDLSMADVKALADVVHSDSNLASALASGSFRTIGMIVAPCSIKTLSAIATSYSDNLIARAADVTLKEHRRLVLLLRETPLHAGHIRLMADATANGAIIYPPVPAFYTRPTSIDDMVDYTVRRALDLFDIDTGDAKRWRGVPELDA